MKLYLFLNLVLLFVSLFSFCSRSGNEEKRKEQIQLILYLQDNKIPTSSSQAACFNFVSIENTCIVIPDSQSTTCSDSELLRLKNGIQPSDKRTDSTLIAFFSCWKNCALLFNVTNSICNEAKYPTTKTYRDAQKSTANAASAAWGACMIKCNNGENEETGLLGTTYPTQPF